MKRVGAPFRRVREFRRRPLVALATGAMAACALFSTPRPELAIPAVPDPAPAPLGPPTPPLETVAVETRPVGAGERAAADGEVRALWVVRSTLTSPAAVRSMVERADESGFNTILVQVRGRGDAYYRSTMEPRAEAIPEAETFDPLALTVELARERGIDVHAWVNLYLVWGLRGMPASRLHVLHSNPEWLAVPRALAHVGPYEPQFVERLMTYAQERSDQIEGVYLSPSNPEAKARLLMIVLELRERYDLDGVHFDYVRLPQSDFDYSQVALREFGRWLAPRLEAPQDLALQARGDLLALADRLPEEWGEFQRANITEMVRWIYHNIKAPDPTMVVSAAVRSGRADAMEHRYQDWGAWVDEGILDLVVPMAYTSTANRFRSFVDETLQVAGPDGAWMGLGAYLNTAESTLDQIDVVRANGFRGLVLFSYDWAVGEGYGGRGPTLLQVVGRERFR